MGVTLAELLATTTADETVQWMVDKTALQLVVNLVGERECKLVCCLVGLRVELTAGESAELTVAMTVC